MYIRLDFVKMQVSSMNNIKGFILHYAFEKPIAVLLRKDINGVLHAKFDERNDFLKFKEGDPVIVYISDDDTCPVKSGDIEYIIDKEETVSIKLDKAPDMQMQSRRKHKRYPASQFCYVKEVYSKKKGTAVIKNISSHGILLLSKSDFNVDDVIEISIYFGNSIYFIEGKIVREFKEKGFWGYGVYVNNMDLYSLKNVREFMRKYQKEFIKNIDINLYNQANYLDFMFDYFEESYASERINDATLRLYEVLRRCK